MGRAPFGYRYCSSLSTNLERIKGKKGLAAEKKIITDFLI